METRRSAVVEKLYSVFILLSAVQGASLKRVFILVVFGIFGGCSQGVFLQGRGREDDAESVKAKLRQD